ncbi:MAG: adenine methyltransferase [Nitrospira sp. CR2.1]|nr:adenine methyltransferase [Nitrospira sp. CR2.1]
MKYMGSKRTMLLNGLGELIREQSRRCTRVVDIFSGSASVSWFAAQNFKKPVFSVDLQDFAVVLSRSVIERTTCLSTQVLESDWLDAARDRSLRYRSWCKAQAIDSASPNAGTWVKRARELCSKERGTGSIWRAYGGYYFSPTQAATFDVLRRSLPKRGTKKWLCLASLVVAASKCAAAPGHTAQPFSTKHSAGRFLREAWLRDPIETTRSSLHTIAKLRARVKGVARVGDAIKVASTLTERDLVFVDPPYSGVHYSRFYHVLETVARGRCGGVEGSGRYPPLDERPTSSFSRKGEALIAMKSLFKSLAEVGCRAIVTFPNHECSNGLSGKSVLGAAEEHFMIAKRIVKTRFSTLGGNGKNRSARQPSSELLLLLTPR